jgi:CheY-like chemotaxis protein
MNTPHDTESRILVASTSGADARLVVDALQEDFAYVKLSTGPERAAADFERHQPHLLVLAFKHIGDAERYYLGLYRLSEKIHVTPHRTLILCALSEASQAFDLCRRRYFDDYVVFWPATYDPYRVRMAAALAVRAVNDSASSDSHAHQYAAHARRIGDLSALLERNLAHGGEHVATMMASVRNMEAGIEMSVEDLSRRFADGSYAELVEVKDPGGLQDELRRHRQQELGASFAQMEANIAPMQQWMHDLKTQLEPSIRAAQALGALAGQSKPLVLIVDDDQFMHSLLRHQLASAGLELLFASNGTGALSIIRGRRPDLILLDFNLPDMSGIDVIRRLKLAERTADIPVIVITGETTHGVVVESHRAGAADIMAKPLDTARLVAGIHKQLFAVEPPAEE